MNITEPLYYAHDLLWEKICQTYMEMLISSLSESKGKFRGMIDDKHMALIDLELLSLEDEYLIKISNNIKNNKILDIMKSQVHAIIQNDKANLSTLISMLKTDDLTELEDYLLDLETKMSKQEEMREQSRREQEEKIEKMRLEQREDEQIAKLQSDYLNNIMKRNTDIEREHIRGKYLITSYNLQNDNDADGIPDIMEADIKYKKFINDVAAREEKINSDRLKLLLDQEEMERKKKEHEDKMQLEREKLKQQNTKQA